MANDSKFTITEDEMRSYINSLTKQLPALRAQAGISQDELAGLIGISRQTLSSVESGKRRMSWPTYLALVLFFDSNQLTRKTFRETLAYPGRVIKRFNKDFSKDNDAVSFFNSPSEISRMLRALDDQGLHALKTVLMLEYARCTKQSGDSVLRSFDGMDFVVTSDTNLQSAQRALNNIKMSNNG